MDTFFKITKTIMMLGIKNYHHQYNLKGMKR
jgi:hypothetical protein